MTRPTPFPCTGCTPRAVAALAWVTLVLPAPALAAGPDRTAQDCPDLTGHYRVTGDGPARTEALAALRAGMAGFIGGELLLTREAGGALAVQTRSSSKGRLSAGPGGTLMPGRDFSCRNGWLVVQQTPAAARQVEQTWYEGRSTVSLRGGGPGGLAVEVRFAGSQRTTVYQYDSARLSLPTPGTGTAQVETLRWPDIGEPAPAGTRIEPPAPEPQAVLAARRQLTPALLGNVRLGPLKPLGDGVQVTLTASRSDDVARLEDRLRAAGLAYEMKTQPVWSNNAWYLQLVLRPDAGGTARGWRPSVHRVQQELRNLGPMTHADKVDEVDGAYVATVTVLGSQRVEDAIARLKANSTLFSQVDVIDESMRADGSRVRTARLRLRLR